MNTLNNITRMSHLQYGAYMAAKKSGDLEKAKRIWEMGFVPDFKEGDADYMDAVIETKKPETFLDFDDVMNDVGAGMENKEVCEKYGITPQKLGAIKKGAK